MTFRMIGIESVILRMKNMPDKTKKTAIVTGGSRGIGAAICKKLAPMGYALHISFLKSEIEFANLQDSLTEYNISLTATIGDIREPSTCRRIIQDCLENHSRLDTVILNAGIFMPGGINDLSNENWRELIDTNLSSTVYLLREALPQLRESGGNVIFIGTGSIANPLPAPQYPFYEASKAGLYVLMKSLSVTEGKNNVRVNIVSPGLVDTGGYAAESIKKLESEIPLGRMGTTSEVADAVAFLLSEEASYINGSNIDVSGGWIRQHQ